MYKETKSMLSKRGVTRTADTGSFHCPQCGSDSAYRHRRVRRFFTFYFVPVVPLEELGEYIECVTCSATFEESVLRYDPEEENRKLEAAFHVGVRRVMVLMMMADGVIEKGEILAIQGLYRWLTQVEISEKELRLEVRRAQLDGIDVRQFAARLVGFLNDTGKEMVLKAAHGVAMGDGKVCADERVLLNEIAGALELSKDRVQEILGGLDARAWPN